MTAATESTRGKKTTNLIASLAPDYRRRNLPLRPAIPAHFSIPERTATNGTGCRTLGIHCDGKIQRNGLVSQLSEFRSALRTGDFRGNEHRREERVLSHCRVG